MADRLLKAANLNKDEIYIRYMFLRDFENPEKSNHI